MQLGQTGFGRFGAVVLLASIVSTSPGHAEDCGRLGGAGGPLTDRSLYVRASGNGWAKLDWSRPDLANRKVEFAYVIVESFAEARSGVLVIKSGRVGGNGEPATRWSGRVKLVRVAQTFDNGRCGTVAPFGGDVPTRSYDDYHDHGLRVKETDKLDAFHFRYAARRSGCRRTNDNAPDSYVAVDMRSNLGQFSFDPAVVSGGTYSQALDWFRPSPAYASSAGLAEQRVETKQYRTVTSQPVCVFFSLDVGGSGSFLRINDLEALVSGGRRFTRADELRWPLVP
ncbi:MAG: hypothetical protein HXX10_17150 [Rhodoplanes sp.]|uniref:hypothetical protein n=1 Tax=Rhodoplanes sp. TaxID=1968906 RepID=UPI0017ABAB6A|nr:hypothetical protein [Rhodoplanes sp.]NVO15762.1 hypothetical protein [Rhodoplanes sp.]